VGNDLQAITGVTVNVPLERPRRGANPTAFRAITDRRRDELSLVAVERINLI
jgi:hypothetical protein